jgi:hypothetical protein
MPAKLSDEQLGELGFRGQVADIDSLLTAAPGFVHWVCPELNMMLLHFAAGSDQGDVAGRVKTLLEHGSDPNAKGHLGRTPLCFAVECSGPWMKEVVTLLLESGADPRITNKFGYDAVATAKVQSASELEPVIELLERRVRELNAHNGAS